MDIQTEILAEIKKNCESCEKLSNKGWHFEYRSNYILYILDDDNKMLRLSIPFVIDATEWEKQRVIDVINDTNRRVKYIKSIVIQDRIVSISYDHKLSTEGELFSELIPHMLDTLDFAANYLKDQLKSQIL